MPLNLVANLFFSLIELVRLSVLVGIPFTIFGVIIRFFSQKLMARFGWAFLYASFSATYVVVLILISFAYFYPLYVGYAESPLTYQPKPPQLSITGADVLAATPVLAVRMAWISFIFTLLLIPLEFVAAFVAETVGNRYVLSGFPKLVAGALGAAFVAVLLVLFVFPFSVSGLIYLLYFG